MAGGHKLLEHQINFLDVEDHAHVDTVDLQIHNLRLELLLVHVALHGGRVVVHVVAVDGMIMLRLKGHHVHSLCHLSLHDT